MPSPLSITYTVRNPFAYFIQHSIQLFLFIEWMNAFSIMVKNVLQNLKTFILKYQGIEFDTFNTILMPESLDCCFQNSITSSIISCILAAFENQSKKSSVTLFNYSTLLIVLHLEMIIELFISLKVSNGRFSSFKILISEQQLW